MLSSELNRQHACAAYKQKGLKLSATKSDEAKFSAIAKQVLDEFFYESKANIFEMSKRISELCTEQEINFPTTQTKRIKCDETAVCIGRYLQSEYRRKDFFLKEIESKDLNIYGLDVSVKPDMVIVKPTSIEVIKIKNSKPTVSMSTKAGNSANNCLELYSMFCYGRSLLKSGENKTVIASYYFLHKDNDSVERNIFDEDFFDKKGKNVVFIYDVVVYNGWCNLDAHFKPLFESFKKGVDKNYLNDDDCKFCEFKHSCKYKAAPQEIEKVTKVTSVKSLKLTEDQKKAIEFYKGIARINAGAGAGKTLVLALRVVNLIMIGCRPEEICLLTFTNSGAREMVERCSTYANEYGLDADMKKLTATTFNAFANSIIEKEYKSLGFTESPTLIDNIDRTDIIANLLEKCQIVGLDYRNFTMNMRYVKGALPMVKKCFDIIKAHKLNKIESKEDAIASLKSILGYETRFIKSEDAYPQILEAFSLYDASLKENNLIEYADQVLMMFDVLENDPDYLIQYGFKHIIVDEFQDSDMAQICLIKEFVKCPSFQSLMVVGDDSQSIFSFRGTSPEFIIHFFDYFTDIPDTDKCDFYLLENHRSTPEILSLANRINERNDERVEKDLVATKNKGKLPDAESFNSKDAEYEYIVRNIKTKVSNGTNPSDIAFICSDRFEIHKMGELLTEQGIEWISLNPEPYLENSKVIAAIALAKAYKNPEDTAALYTFLNCLYENDLFDKNSNEDIEKLLIGLQKELISISQMPDTLQKMEFHDLMIALEDSTNKDELYESFIERVERKKTLDAETTYMVAFEKYGEAETYKREGNYPGVVLTTAHSSKGLEWPVVFLSISKFHTKMLENNKKAQEEKRRLLFVAITRAKDELYVTGQYNAYGSEKNGYVANMYLREVFESLDLDFASEHERKAV